MKNKNFTELIYILDRSGSMQGMEEPAVESFNRFLKDQKSVEGQANITLMLFDTEFLKPINAQDIATVNKMTADRFEPRGATALLDAIGISIKETRKRIKALPEQEQPGKVIFAIFTDGYENSSRLYDWSEISAKIAKRTSKDGWEFLFLAANEDAIATASRLNIDQNNASQVEFSKAGMSTWGGSASNKIRAMRKESMGMDYDSEHRSMPLADMVEEDLEEKKRKSSKTS